MTAPRNWPVTSSTRHPWRCGSPIRFAHSSDTAANLKATLETRTVIDVAVGIIMAQNRCSQDEAFELLKSASSARNIKLHAVAAGVVESLGQGPTRTHFEV